MQSEATPCCPLRETQGGREGGREGAGEMEEGKRGGSEESSIAASSHAVRKRAKSSQRRHQKGAGVRVGVVLCASTEHASCW